MILSTHSRGLSLQIVYVVEPEGRIKKIKDYVTIKLSESRRNFKMDFTAEIKKGVP